jgi:hypothetical protein
MRFKDWLLSEYGGGGGAATSIMHGGIQDIPGEKTHADFPVRSKYVTPDAKSDTTDQPKPRPEEKAAKKFGFDDPSDKEEARERLASWIDKRKRSTPLRVLQVYT